MQRRGGILCIGHTEADAEGVIIVMSYFYKGFPFIALGAVVLLAVPYLGLIIFGIVALVALASLALAIAFVPYTLGQRVNRRWQHAHNGSPDAAPVLSPAEHRNAEATFGKGRAS